MAKILHEGKMPTDHPYKHRCNYCGTVAEYTDEEDRRESGAQAYVNCPLCKEEIKWSVLTAPVDDEPDEEEDNHG